ncbi:hypothetical protein [Gloeobacter violaceus]|uniref:hypothetical protein n=1 Tax=Gloeobacter violaceus TaxID=33072 RepID=UPI0013E8BD4A|nr:hypothetical protein [Gloeobacter violaceus]
MNAIEHDSRKGVTDLRRLAPVGVRVTTHSGLADREQWTWEIVEAKLYQILFVVVSLLPDNLAGGG